MRLTFQIIMQEKLSAFIKSHQLNYFPALFNIYWCWGKGKGAEFLIEICHLAVASFSPHNIFKLHVHYPVGVLELKN